MKKNLTFLCLFTGLSLFAQTKKYALVEHFTNTLCGICAGTNPSFFTATTVETNANMHHISYHSRTPYSSCVFYQANKTPQDNRATFYALPGTPRASINGQALVALGNITNAMITQNAGNNASLSVKVTELAGTTRSATIKIKAFQNFAGANHRLFVALVEKKVAYNAPNSEKTHYNVFRKFLNTTNDAGDAMADIANNAETTLTFNYTLETGWVPNEMYVVAWVQNATTKEVLNSGTRFDITSSVDDRPSVDAQVSVSPNPTVGKTVLTFDKLTPQYLTLSNAAGQIVQHVKLSNSTNYELDMTQFSAGFYIAKVIAAEGIAVKKIVRD